MPLSPEQIDALNSPLPRDAVKSRSQAGRSLSYIEAWYAIDQANQIFGFDAWDRETVEMRMVSERTVTIGKGKHYEKEGWSVSYIAKVRVTVHTEGRSIIKEGTGAGHGIDADLGQAHESATKEAESDAMKRALMQFGNPFGLALYDKTQANVEDVPAQPKQAAPTGEMSKGQARELYKRLQADLDACTSIYEVRKWKADNTGDLEKLPSDWRKELGQRGADMIKRLEQGHATQPQTAMVL